MFEFRILPDSYQTFSKREINININTLLKTVTSSRMYVRTSDSSYSKLVYLECWFFLSLKVTNHIYLSIISTTKDFSDTFFRKVAYLPLNQQNVSNASV